MPQREDSLGSHVAVGHWIDERTGRRELIAPIFERHYTVSVLLGRAVVDCYKDGRLRGKGTGGPGGLQLTAPGERVECGFRGSNEAIHIFFPHELVESECETGVGRGGVVRLDDPGFRVDPVIGPLARGVARAQVSNTGGDGPAPCNELIYAILRHVLSRYAHDGARRGGAHGLSAARLRRVIDYIDANLAEPITLEDIALQSGLSRMHFAAQFRLATGSTPHTFLRARRMERAQTLLLKDWPIVEVALAVGFQGQSHFTTVFRELNGETPRRWRERHGHLKPSVPVRSRAVAR